MRATFDDRYRLLGLARNPFAAPQRGEPPSISFVDRGLPNPPSADTVAFVQVIGPAGFGKSTHLSHWRSIAPGPLHYIPRRPYRTRWNAPPEPRAGGVVYGDEVDRMPALRRAAWFRACARDGTTMVIGTHVDLSRVAQRWGYDDVRTHHLAPLDRSALDRFVRGRLNAVAIDDRGLESFSDEELDTTLEHSRGIPREAEMILHKILATRANASPRVTR